MYLEPVHAWNVNYCNRVHLPPCLAHRNISHTSSLRRQFLGSFRRIHTPSRSLAGLRTRCAQTFLPEASVFLPQRDSYASIRPLISGGGNTSRSMRSRIVANNFRVTATSASWNITYFECRVTFTPILTSLSRRVVNDQCFTLRRTLQPSPVLRGCQANLLGRKINWASNTN